MSNNVVDYTDQTSRKVAHLVRLFNKLYKEVDWSKVSKEINIEISWLNYAFQLTNGFTKDVGQWTNSFIVAKIKRLLHEQQVEYRPHLCSYLVCLTAYLCPDMVIACSTLTGAGYFQMRL